MKRIIFIAVLLVAAAVLSYPHGGNTLQAAGGAHHKRSFVIPAGDTDSTIIINGGLTTLVAYAPTQDVNVLIYRSEATTDPDTMLVPATGSFSPTTDLFHSYKITIDRTLSTKVYVWINW